MKPSGTIRTLAILAALSAWVSPTPAHAQFRRGGGGGGGGGWGGGGGLSGGTGFSNFANQFMRGGYNNSLRQPPTYPRALPPLGGSSMGGIQGQPGGSTTSPSLVGPSNMGGLNRPSNFNSGSLFDAFGGPSQYQTYQQPQYQNQPQYQQSQYQQPQYQPRSRYSTYQQQTRQVSSRPIPGKRYRIPAAYGSYPAGSVITWGQYRYVLGDDGTMTLDTDPAPTTSAVAETEPASAGPTPGQRYQIPAEHAGTAPGTQVTYAGYHYVTNTDGTMTAFNSPAEEDANDKQTPTGPVPGKRYQIPAEHVNAAPGSLVTYAGYSYVANTDGTMTAFTPPE